MSGAELVACEYAATRRRFYIVQCDACLTVLNSGHHYYPTAANHAQRLADEHNARHHAAGVFA